MVPTQPTDPPMLAMSRTPPVMMPSTLHASAMFPTTLGLRTLLISPTPPNLYLRVPSMTMDHLMRSILTTWPQLWEMIRSSMTLLWPTMPVLWTPLLVLLVCSQHAPFGC